MRWARSLGSWCSLGVTIAAVVAGASYGKRYVERQLIASTLGGDATRSKLQVHWSRSAGCIEDIHVPLPYSYDLHNGALSLHADKLWFVFDQSELLRKRLVLPKVVIEDAVIATDFASDASTENLEVEFELEPSFDLGESTSPTSEAQPTAHAASAKDEWIRNVEAFWAELSSEKFVTGRQVSVDAGMLSEHMRAHFENLHQQAIRILNEARDIQQYLASLDNILRHEQQVIASRERLEQLRAGLVGLKTEVTRADRALADEQARIRSALLVEKEELKRRSETHEETSARSIASAAIEHALKSSLEKPIQYATLLSSMMSRPLANSHHGRGQDLRGHLSSMPELAIGSVKISGAIESSGRPIPFTASGDVKVMPVDPDGIDLASYQAMGDKAQWQMSIGDSDRLVELKATGNNLSREHRKGFQSTFDIRSQDCGQLQMQGAMSWLNNDGREETLQPISPSSHVEPTSAASSNALHMQAHGSLNFREWVSDQNVRRVMMQNPSLDDVAKDCLAQALAREDAETPETLRFLGESLSSEPELELSSEAVDWLGNKVTELATARSRQLYLNAADRLATHIDQKMLELQRDVVMMRNSADTFLNQQMDELRRLQSAINLNLQQRAGTHFARQPSNEVIR